MNNTQRERVKKLLNKQKHSINEIAKKVNVPVSEVTALFIDLMNEDKEPGSASIFIDLENSKITVKHGTDGDILIQREVKRGYWDKLFKLLREDD